jgi:cobalt transport protein
MAIAGPFLTYGLYTVCKKLKVNKKVSVFISTALGDLFTYCVTSLQLAIAYPSEDGGVGASVVKFLGIFAITQLPLAIIEGLLSVVIVSALEVYAKDELADLGYNLSSKVAKPVKKSVIACIVAVLLIAFVPFFALKGADFGGSDDAGSELVAELNGDDYEPWAEPIIEKYLGSELPGEIESLLFCLQTGIGTSIIAFCLGRLVERKKDKSE